VTVTTQRADYREVVAALTRRLQRLGDRPHEPDKALYRIEIELEATDPLRWLQAQAEVAKVYWHSRDGRFEIAGVGEADVMTSTDPDAKSLDLVIQTLTESGADTSRYFGGFRFDPTYPHDTRDERWDSFGAYRLVLPRFELRRDDDRHLLVCNLHRRDLGSQQISEIVSQAGRLAGAGLPAEPTRQKPTRRDDNPGHDRWLTNVERTLDGFRAGEIDKLVLARKTELDFEAELNPWQLLERLRATTSNCFLFGLQATNGSAFIGATPERLYRRDRDQIRTEAVAGTRPRGIDAETDSELEKELTLSEKEREEHRLVVTGLREGLERICAECRVDDLTGSLKLARLQHLVTRLSGRLRENLNDLRILTELHPSPAVGGYPTASAPEQLRKAEPFDRGWYAGPIGWIGINQAEFAVAIRSALVRGRQLDLFAGAGLVPDSDPEAEWNEVESKIGPFLRLTEGDTT
jgi:menaquinone-specific isochorismate synthase